MRCAVLGTGMVGRVIGARLVEVGDEVAMGSRSADNQAARDWAAQCGDRARSGTFADAAAFGEMVWNCTAGAGTLEALQAAGSENLSGKVLVDLANPLDTSTHPPRLTVVNDDSLAEQIQRTFPEARVVKALNTMNNQVMVHPELIPGTHHAFLCGDDARAREEVTGVLQSFGWPRDHVLDLGGLEAARGLEGFLLLWLRLWPVAGRGHFNVAVVRSGAALG